MKTSRSAQILVLTVLFGFALFACSHGDNSSETGSVSINLSGGNLLSRSALSGWPPEDSSGGTPGSGPTLASLYYRVFFDGNQKTGARTSDNEITFTVEPGTYDILIEAYEDSAATTLYATGKQPSVIVVAGVTTPVTITMDEAVTVTFD